jgi:hypothetical protein
MKIDIKYTFFIKTLGLTRYQIAKVCEYVLSVTGYEWNYTDKLRFDNCSKVDEEVLVKHVKIIQSMINELSPLYRNLKLLGVFDK